MSPELKYEIEGLKKIVDNLHDKMHVNIKAYEKGKSDLATLKKYLLSCNEINMGRLTGCLGRIKDLTQK